MVDRLISGRERFEIEKSDVYWSAWFLAANAGRTVFSQLIEHLPQKEFQKCVVRDGGDRYAKNLSCRNQYLALAFAQLTYRETLRDIEACLKAVGGQP